MNDLSYLTTLTRPRRSRRDTDKERVYAVPRAQKPGARDVESITRVPRYLDDPEGDYETTAGGW